MGGDDTAIVPVIDPAALEAALAALRAGELVAFPTETVYGLGGDAANPAAVRRIFEAKGRPADHPVIVHVATADAIEAWARDIPPAAWALAEAFWPGPMTLVLRRRAGVSDLVTGGQDTVGLRVPSHPVAHALLAAFGGGVAGPSANRFGQVSPTTAAHVREELGDRVRLVLDGGQSAVGIESAIIDLSGAEPALLRPGMLDPARVEAVLGRGLRGSGRGSPRAPGMLASHYAPRTPTHLIPAGQIESAAATAAGTAAVLAFGPCPPGLPVIRWQRVDRDPAAYAHDLYANLRLLDHVGANCILVEAVPEDAAWAAIRDRLGRAATPPDAS